MDRFLLLGAFIALAGCFEPSLPPMLECGSELADCPQPLVCDRRACVTPDSLPNCPMPEMPLLSDSFETYPVGMWTLPPQWDNVFVVDPGEITITEDGGNQLLSLRGITENNAITTTDTFVDFDLTVRVRLIAIDQAAAIDFNHQEPLQPVYTNRVSLDESGWQFQRKEDDVTTSLDVVAEPPFALQTWYGVRIRKTANTFEFFVCNQTTSSWESKGIDSDTRFASGKLGLVGLHADVDYDDVAIYPLSP
jgi:hypothetical protein